MALQLFVIYDKDVEISLPKYVELIRSDCSEGVNIANKINYSDLRAQYWVWKNKTFEDSDQIGFFHYRRYLDLRNKVCEFGTAKKSIPYRIKNAPPTVITEGDISEITDEYDIIAPICEYTGVSVRERYRQSPRHHGQDLDVIYQILKETYPKLICAADKYLNGRSEYYGNIYIMKWRAFCEYCEWLFSILEEFDRRIGNNSFQSDGFLGERLFGIYFTWFAAQVGTHCGELPRIHFSMYDDENHHFKRERIINIFLPPGSKFRGWVRKQKYRLDNICNMQNESNTYKNNIGVINK